MPVQTEPGLHVPPLQQGQNLLGRVHKIDDDTEILTYPGYEEAIVGFGWQFNTGPITIYDRDAVIRILESQGMTEEDAEDYFSYNVAGAWLGEQTPIFMIKGFQPPFDTADGWECADGDDE